MNEGAKYVAKAEGCSGDPEAWQPARYSHVELTIRPIVVTGMSELVTQQ